MVKYTGMWECCGQCIAGPWQWVSIVVTPSLPPPPKLVLFPFLVLLSSLCVLLPPSLPPHSNILVHPQWHHFRHIRMLRNDQVRLSNGIWRSWHLQCKQNIYCLCCPKLNPHVPYPWLSLPLSLLSQVESTHHTHLLPECFCPETCSNQGCPECGVVLNVGLS